MWNKNALTEMLKIDFPIIQGPFGGGFSTTLLAATVSNNGGLGSFGAHNLSPSQIVEKVKEIRTHTNRPFGINLWVSSSDPEVQDVTRESYAEIGRHYQSYFKQFGLELPPFPEKFGEDFEDQIEALLEARPPVFSFVFGIPDKAILEECRRRGIITVGAATTLAEAIAVEKAGVDAVVVTGFEAGGHRPSFIKSAEESLHGLGALLSQVSEKIKIPMIAAGGLVNAKSIVAARTLGAQGFQLGTAFLACEESGASRLHKEAIFGARAHHTILSRQYSGRLARFIENHFLAETRKNQTPFLPYPAQNYLLAKMKKASAEKGEIEITPLYAGQGAPLVKHKKAKDVMDALIREIPELL